MSYTAAEIDALNKPPDWETELIAAYALLDAAVMLALRHIGTLSPFEQWSFWLSFNALGESIEGTWIEGGAGQPASVQIEDALTEAVLARNTASPFALRAEVLRNLVRRAETEVSP